MLAGAVLSGYIIYFDSANSSILKASGNFARSTELCLLKKFLQVIFPLELKKVTESCSESLKVISGSQCPIILSSFLSIFLTWNYFLKEISKFDKCYAWICAVFNTNFWQVQSVLICSCFLLKTWYKFLCATLENKIIKNRS